MLAQCSNTYHSVNEGIIFFVIPKELASQSARYNVVYDEWQELLAGSNWNAQLLTWKYITCHLIRNSIFWKKYIILVNSYLIIVFIIFSHLTFYFIFFQSSAWLLWFHSRQGLIITLGRQWIVDKLTLSLEQVMKQEARFVLFSFCSGPGLVIRRVMILFLNYWIILTCRAYFISHG